MSVKTDKIKISTYITEDADRKVEALVKVTGMSKSKLAALAIQAGIDAIGLAFNPDWKDYFEKLAKNWEAGGDEKIK